MPSTVSKQDREAFLTRFGEALRAIQSAIVALRRIQNPGGEITLDLSVQCNLTPDEYHDERQIDCKTIVRFPEKPINRTLIDINIIYYFDQERVDPLMTELRCALAHELCQTLEEWAKSVREFEIHFKPQPDGHGSIILEIDILPYIGSAGQLPIPTCYH